MTRDKNYNSSLNPPKKSLRKIVEIFKYIAEEIIIFKIKNIIKSHETYFNEFIYNFFLYSLKLCEIIISQVM